MAPLTRLMNESRCCCHIMSISCFSLKMDQGLPQLACVAQRCITRFNVLIGCRSIQLCPEAFEWKWKNENEIQLTELPLTSTKSFILTGPSLPQVYVVIMLKTVTGTDCGDFCPSTSARFCYINVFCLSYIDNSVYWNSYPENFNCIITLCLQCDGSYS